MTESEARGVPKWHIRFSSQKGLEIQRSVHPLPPLPAGKKKKSLLEQFLELLGTGAWVLGIYAAFQQDHKGVSPVLVAGGAAALLIPSASAARTMWRRQKFGEVTGVLLPLWLSFGLLSDHRHLRYRPWWFAVAELAVAAIIVFVIVPMATVLWRRTADERDRTIAFSSMAIALFAVLIVAFAFSAMHSVNVGPMLQPDWILYTGSTVWFVAWFYLQRRM